MLLSRLCSIRNTLYINTWYINNLCSKEPLVRLGKIPLHLCAAAHLCSNRVQCFCVSQLAVTHAHPRQWITENVNCYVESYSPDLNTSWRNSLPDFLILLQIIGERPKDTKHICFCRCAILISLLLFWVSVWCVCVPELKASIDRLTQKLEGMYSDNSLCQVRLTLT